MVSGKGVFTLKRGMRKMCSTVGIVDLELGARVATPGEAKVWLTQQKKPRTAVLETCSSERISVPYYVN